MAYFANGTEGDQLTAQCEDCPLGYGWNDPSQLQLFEFEAEPRPCPIAAVQLIFNYDQIGNDKLTSAMNILVDKNGVCQVRKQLEEIRRQS